MIATTNYAFQVPEMGDAPDASPLFANWQLLDALLASSFYKAKDLSGDLDTIFTAGTYSGTYTNYPSGVPDGQGNVIVLPYAAGASAGWTRQIFMSAHTSDIYARNCSNSVWQPWSRVAKTADIPTSLPANGGNADTVDTKHAADFVQKLILTDAIVDNAAYTENYIGDINIAAARGSMPAGWYHVIYGRHQNTNGYGFQLWNAFGSNDLWIRSASGTTWTSPRKLSDGGNADTVDGLHVHTGTNNVANQIVRTDANGYINTGWINTISGAASGTLTRIYCSQDAYLRYMTPANFKTALGITTPGTGVDWSMVNHSHI